MANPVAVSKTSRVFFETGGNPVTLDILLFPSHEPSSVVASGLKLDELESVQPNVMA